MRSVLSVLTCCGVIALAAATPTHAASDTPVTNADDPAFAEHVVAHSPWVGTWREVFGGRQGNLTVIFSFKVEGETRTLVAEITNTAGTRNEGPVTSLTIDEQRISFRDSAGEKYGLKSKDVGKRLQGSARKRELDIVLDATGGPAKK